MKTIICLKAGTKYDSIYVNNLYSMVKRNMRSEFRFICFTDDSRDLDEHIEIRKLPSNGLTGWWYKVWLFSRDAGLHGDILYLDLDIVITNLLEPFFDQKIETVCAIKDWLFERRGIFKLNSSVVLFKAEKCYSIWEEFEHNMIANMGTYPGDQDWLSVKAVNPMTWDDGWCTSFKYNRQYEHIDPVTKIVVFHGVPNPPDAITGDGRFPPCPWITTLWR